MNQAPSDLTAAKQFPASALAPVFVSACAWRSGSTLLQRLIISSGEVFVWGENAAMTSYLLRICKNIARWESLIERQRRNFQKHHANGWIANLNPVPPVPSLEASRAFFLHYYYPATEELGYTRWGFKEVRHGAEQVSYLLECFPKCRIVFLLRHPRDVLASNAANEWYPDLGGAAGVIRRWMRNVASISELRDTRILLLRFEDILSDIATTTARLEQHLGLSTGSIDVDILQQRIRGARTQPRLGPQELRVLATPELEELANAHGYDVTGLSRGGE